MGKATGFLEYKRENGPVIPEEERVKAYEDETDENKKQEIEKQNSIERTKSTIIIKEAKEANDEKIKEYEKKLKGEII